jgi:hypothetical protein
MTLEIHEISWLVIVASAEEVIETDLEQGYRGRVGRNVTSDTGIFLVLAMHHRHGIPTH